MWKWEDQMGSNYSWQGEGLWWYRWRRGERVTDWLHLEGRADWTCWWRWEGETFRATLQPKPERLDGCWLSATEMEDPEGAKVFMEAEGSVVCILALHMLYFRCLLDMQLELLTCRMGYIGLKLKRGQSWLFKFGNCQRWISDLNHNN